MRKIITRDAKHKALSARQPFPTACLEEEEKNKKEKGGKKINKNLNPATYRDLSWQLSKKKKKPRAALSAEPLHHTQDV